MVEYGGNSLPLVQVFKDHNCVKQSEQFASLHSSEADFDALTQSLCDGLSSLVSHEIKESLLHRACTAPWQSKEFCVNYTERVKEATELIGLSPKLPAGSLNAISAITTISGDSVCDYICGGIKGQMCSMLLYLGKVFTNKGPSALVGEAEEVKEDNKENNISKPDGWFNYY
jgi:hypothetical protein